MRDNPINWQIVVSKLKEQGLASFPPTANQGAVHPINHEVAKTLQTLGLDVPIDLHEAQAKLEDSALWKDIKKNKSLKIWVFIRKCG